MWGEKADKKKEDALIEENTYTFLGKGVDFKGEAKFDSSVRIDGCFEGHILMKENTLIVGEQGFIKGDIICGVIICGGKIDGTITASQKVQLLKSAVLIGTIRTPSFSAEEGALFHGACDMGVSEFDHVSLPSDESANVPQELSMH